MPHTIPKNTEVLVVGAGPAGATLGAYLTKRGINVTVIDKKSEPERYSKAGNLWPRTLEMLGGMVPGVLERIEPKSFRLKTLSVYGYNTHTADVPGDKYDSPYHAAFLNGQNVIETSLWDVLAQMGSPVFTETTFVSAEEDQERVIAQVEHGGEVHTIQARYMVGCDAGRSLVRKAAGLDFEPESQIGVQLLIIDATLQWNRPTTSDRMWMFFYDNGYIGVVPQWGGHHHIWRFEGVAEPLQRDPTPEDFVPKLREVTGDPSVHLSNPIWSSHIANPRTGVAPGLRSSGTNIFLAGDAGHVALPVGGQGMNTGIQDALAIGWRLVDVLQGKANAVLLDSYEAERLPVRRDLRDDQVSSMRAMMNPGFMQKFGMKVLGPLLAKTTGATEFRGQRDSAMLKLSYPDGLLVKENASGSRTKAGTRAPDALVAHPGGRGVHLHDLIYGHGGWTLLAFGGVNDGKTGERAVAVSRFFSDHPNIATYAVISGQFTENPAQVGNQQNLLFDFDGFAHAAFHVSAPMVVLVRPDGYIGYRGALDETGVSAFMKRVMVTH